MVKKIILMLCLIACMTSIFIFSSQNSQISGDLSGGITQKIAEIFVKDFDTFSPEKQRKIVEGMHFYIRKAAHFSIYAALGFFAFLNADIYIRRTGRKFLLSLPFCLIYAASDEIHQLFTDGRCGSPIDVRIDFSGSVTGTLVAFCILNIFTLFFKKLLTNKKNDYIINS